MFEIAREFGHFQINKEYYDNLYVLTDNNYYASKVLNFYIIILNEKIKLGKFGGEV